MKNISVVLVFLCAALIFTAFFLPWVSVNSSVKGLVVKVFGSQDASIMKISGYQVPILANREDSRLMITVIKLFNPGIQDADKKSWLIWAVPILSVLLAFAYMMFNKNKWFDLGLGILGVAIFAVGLYEILVTDLNKMGIEVEILNGVWLTLVGYLCIGLIAFFKFTQKRR